ncbi:hypothetical protein LY13_001778 [Prauserella aidingensis]|uniref:hypothetical protein n=1 Tax=Prauserella aidingensis TaxID=387890 RepID=UPI0020A41497|nr:hypothetical protein [Prauserella aidingensis]MCP2253034.1 hypothetical protein [Prauserella aidingensis]
MLTLSLTRQAAGFEYLGPIRAPTAERTDTEGSPTDMHPGTLMVILLGLCALGAIVAFLVSRRNAAAKKVGREEFARRTGAVEHYYERGTRPSFGVFPGKDAHTGAPFTYAVEFTYGGFPVVAAEWRMGGGTMQARYTGIIQVPSGLPADAPYLMIGEHMRYGVDPETGGRLPALKGFADERLRVLSPDEEFARRIVTPEVAAIFAEHRRSRMMPRVTVEGGVLHMLAAQRLDPDGLFRNAELLTRLARTVAAQQHPPR